MTTQEKLFQFIDTFNIHTSTQKPSEWAELNRVLTFGSNHKGRWKYSLTPYMREVVDRLSPDDPTRVLVLMAGSQLGKSHGFVFNGIGYIMKHRPTNILLTCGDEDLTKDAMTKIDEMIQNSGLKDLVRSNSIKKSNQKSGDTDRMKEFVGGMLIAQSIKAPDKIKQNSFEVIFLDDIESAVRSNSKNVGDIVKLAFARATSFSDTYKINLIGVPEIESTSIIKPAFLKGDQRHFFLPCPLCGEYIQIVWREKIEGETKEHAGVTFKTDNGGHLIEDSVGYICQKCHGFFKETHKTDMLQNGQWKPTAISSQPNWLSYHLPALLAPRGFFNWTHYAHEWLSCFPSEGVTLESSLQHFKNHVLAETYEIRKKEVSASKIIRNTRDYEIGTIPNALSKNDGNGEIILITCACDLNGFEDDARLDYEILAHSENGSTYSIDHGSVGTFQRSLSQEGREKYTYNHTKNNNVWTPFKDICDKSFTTDEGKQMKVAIVGVDTGAFTQLSYSFIDKGINGIIVVGLKGDPTEKARRVDADSKIYKEATERNDLYWVQGNMIKDRLSEFVKLEYESGYPQPSGFMNYPQPSDGKYDFKYFDQYESEHRKPILNATGIEIAFAWEKKGQQSKNHFWDVRVYGMALKDIFVKIISKQIGKPITWGDLCDILK